MSQILNAYWDSDASGSWSDASKWETGYIVTNPDGSTTVKYSHAVPSGSSYDVSLTPYDPTKNQSTGTAPFTVTYNTSDNIYSLEGPSFYTTSGSSVSSIATLKLVGGTLNVASTVNMAGAVNVYGGTLEIQNDGNGTSNIGTRAADPTYGYLLLPALNVNGGTLKVDAGSLNLSGTNTIAGNVTGAGTVYVTGFSSLAINSGAHVTAGKLELGVAANGTESSTTLNTDLSYGGTFQTDDVSGNNSQQYLNGHTLTLSGNDNFYGTIHGSGSLVLASGGSATFNDGAAAVDGIAITNNGTATQTGRVALAGSLDNKGTYDVASDANLNAAGSSAITNEGTLAKTAGTGDSVLYGSFTSSGTVDVQTGTLGVSGSGGTLSGTIKGKGEFDMGGGGTYTLAPGLNLAVAKLGVFNSNTDVVLGADTTYAGALDVNGYEAPITLDLGSHKLTLTGTATLTAPYSTITLKNGGTLLVAQGASAAIDSLAAQGGVTIENKGTVTDNGNNNLDSDGGSAQSLFQNDAGGVVDIAVDGNAFGNGGAHSLVTNAGTIDKTQGTGTSTIYDPLTNTGTLEADTGEIELRGGGTLGGMLTGSGSLALRGGQTYTIQPGTAVSVANLDVYDQNTNLTLGEDLSYAGSFTDNANEASNTINLGGHTFTITNTATLTAPYAQITVKGGTFLVAQGATASIDGTGVAGGATIENKGTITDGGYIFLDSDGGGTQSLFKNDAGGVVNITQDNTAFDNSGTSALITNAGRIAKTQGTGTSTINDALTNTGTLEVDTGEIDLRGGGTLGGVLSGAGILALRGGKSYTLQSGSTLNVSTLDIYDGGTTVNLGRNFTYAGSFNADISFSNETIDLAGHLLTLTGPSTLEGTYGALNFTGGGTVKVAAGQTSTIYGTNLAGGVNLQNNGTIDAGNNIVLDSDGTSSASTFTNNAVGTVDIGSDGTIFDKGGSAASIVNNGEIDKTQGGGTSTINDAVTNNGLIVADSGTIRFNGGLTNAGILQGVVSTSNGTTTLTADQAGQLHLTGGSGNNTFVVQTAPTRIDGGAGVDTVEVGGNVSFAAGSLVSVEKVLVDAGATANLSALSTGESIALASTASQGSTVVATGGYDVITGGAGSDTMTGGGGSDTYIYKAAANAAQTIWGHDEIKDFYAGGKPGHDILQFGSSAFANFDDAMNHAADTSGGTLITLNSGSSIMLDGVKKSSLVAQDFKFV